MPVPCAAKTDGCLLVVWQHRASCAAAETRTGAARDAVDAAVAVEAVVAAVAAVAVVVEFAVAAAGEAGAAAA